MDWFLYSGDIRRGGDLQFVEFVAKEKASNDVTLLLCTPGGTPDAAYKMGRYLQSRYETFRLFVPGYCKSAGTLLAIAASEIIFSPYGEIGPLDIQMTKTDNLAVLESRLNISEAFITLEKRARDTFHDLVIEIIRKSDGIISFQTASHSAAEVVASLFGPIFARIDPEEVGSRARAMRIGEDYGLRLNDKYSNLKPNALEMISQSYTSHGFVIDLQEAKLLFNNTREALDSEKELVEKVGGCCRIPERNLKMENLTSTYNEIVPKEGQNDQNEEHEAASKKGAKPGKPAKKRTNNGKDSLGAITA